MDMDMHYYGTYAMARAAGLNAETALTIATAAEFVDDSTETEVYVHPDGARFQGEATAHHPTELKPINDLDDQILVWVPFHFLPGGIGTSQSQRLVCRKDSPIAQEMVSHALDLSDRPYAAELLGITAHVYADTFAHYGFSGVSSRLNRVDGESLKAHNNDPMATSMFEQRLNTFMAKFGVQGGLVKNFRSRLLSGGAEIVSGALGHGAVATFPDQPYLEWSYGYEMADLWGAGWRVERANADDFIEGARALHGMFREFATRRPDLSDGKGGYDFDQLAPTVRALVTLIAHRDARITAWKKRAAEGAFSRDGVEALSDYDHRPWRDQAQALKTLPEPSAALELPVYRFHLAAAIHRNFVLRDLLPQHGIVVV